MSRHARTVLVTAGASGIGRWIAKGFSAEGAQVHICDSSAAAIAAMAREEPDITATLADVAQVGDVSRVFEDLNDRYGELDVLINNVGISGPTAAMEDIDIEAWHETINVNLNSLFYVSRLAIPLLKRSSGQIVNMASNAGLYGCPLRSPYVAAKWAMIGLTKTLAMELGAHGVRVNAICPGFINTPLADGGDPEATAKAFGKAQPWPEQGRGDHIAGAALFLASDDAEFVTGEHIIVDGGLTAAGPELSRRFPKASARTGRYSGVTKGSTGIDPELRRL